LLPNQQRFIEQITTPSSVFLRAQPHPCNRMRSSADALRELRDAE